jgi:hypothetical protein
MAVPDENDKSSGEWPTIRDSWVEEVPATVVASMVAVDLPVTESGETAAPKSLPPPLPGSTPALPVCDPDRADLMFERLAASDYEGALLVAQSVLSLTPHDQDALECAEISARELWNLHVRRLGSLDRVPRALVAPDALPPTLNLRAGFLLARVDGSSSIQKIVDHAGLPLIDALRGIAELYLCGAIGFNK